VNVLAVRLILFEDILDVIQVAVIEVPAQLVGAALELVDQLNCQPPTKCWTGRLNPLAALAEGELIDGAPNEA